MSDSEERVFEELPLPGRGAPTVGGDRDDATVLDANMLDPVALASEATILRPSESLAASPLQPRAPSSDALIGDLVGTGAWILGGLERREERTMLAHAPSQMLDVPGAGTSLEGVGELFAGYRLVGSIGTGGMAHVDLAIDESGDAPTWCVVKRIREKHLADQMYVDMFREECRIGALLKHSNIIHTIGSGDVSGVPYLALELVDGMSTSGLMRLAPNRRLPSSVVVEVAQCTARGLQYAHSLAGPDGRPLNLVHRDVSPENILVGKGGAIKLADFGIARFEGRDHETAVGKVKGKIVYMAPEQLRLQPVDARTDIFALGLVIIELLSGRVLFPNSAALIEDPAPHVTAALRGRDDIPPDFLNLILAMLRHDAAQRPANMSVVYAYLENISKSMGRSQEAKAYLRQALDQVPQPEDVAAAMGGDHPDPELKARLKAAMGELGQKEAYPTSFGLMYSALSTKREANPALASASAPAAPISASVPAAPIPLVFDVDEDEETVDAQTAQPLSAANRAVVRPAAAPPPAPAPPPGVSTPHHTAQHGLRLTPSSRPGSVPPTMGGPRPSSQPPPSNPISSPLPEMKPSPLSRAPSNLIAQVEPSTQAPTSSPVARPTSAPPPPAVGGSAPPGAVQSQPALAVQSQPALAVQSQPELAVQSQPELAVPSQPAPAAAPVPVAAAAPAAVSTPAPANSPAKRVVAWIIVLGMLLVAALIALAVVTLL